jgi:hypothetical protein
MTPATIIARKEAAIALYGKAVTLQHTAVDAAGAVTVLDEVTCPANVRSFVPQDLAAGEVQDIRVIVSGSALGDFGLPSRDDRIIIDGNPSDVTQIEPLYFGGVLVRVNMLCRG